MSTENTPCGDPTVERVVAMLRSRSEFGLKKYGTPLSAIESQRAALQHALEEALDLANYLMTAIDKLDGK